MIPESIRQQVFTELGCPPEAVKLLGGYNDNVFELERAGAENIVVKLLDHSVVPKEHILPEMEWLNYLQESEVSAIRPLCLESGKYIYPVSEPFYYILFHKVKGTHVNREDKTVWNPLLFEHWGEAMGRLHSCARSYQAVHPHPHWQENIILLAERIEIDALLSQKWKVYQEEFSRLGTSGNEFGLIHGDLHPHNFLVHDGSLTVIDFGDAEYHWFAYDIAIAVYHMAQTVPEDAGKKDAVLAFYHAFMKGYRRGNTDTGFMAQIGYFIDYRHLYSYTYHMVHTDPGALTEGQKAYLARMRRTIEAGEPCLGFRLL
jgi:amicoumacin kinase